jgi:hypothetical protein
MPLRQSFPWFEELEETLSPATFNDASNASLDSSEKGHFEEHFIAALWIDDFFQDGLFTPSSSLS